MSFPPPSPFRLPPWLVSLSGFPRVAKNLAIGGGAGGMLICRPMAERRRSGQNMRGSHRHFSFNISENTCIFTDGGVAYAAFRHFSPPSHARLMMDCNSCWASIWAYLVKRDLRLISFDRYGLVAIACCSLVICSGPSLAANYEAVTNGFWSNPAIWSPVGGPPGENDTANIGVGLVTPVTVTLNELQPISILNIGNGVLNLNGNSLTSSSLTLDSTGGAATLTKSGGTVQLQDADASGW